MICENCKHYSDLYAYCVAYEYNIAKKTECDLFEKGEKSSYVRMREIITEQYEDGVLDE